MRGLSPKIKSGDSQRSCDKTISKIRGLSPKIKSDDSQRNENMQTQHKKHTIPILRSHSKVITYLYHVLELQEVKLQKIPQKISQRLRGSEHFCASVTF
jgi:hypothetical protein